MDEISVSVADLIERYAAAQGALQQIEERLRLSPVAAPWKIRMSVAEKYALSRIDGVFLDEADISVDGRGTVSTSLHDPTCYQIVRSQPISLTALTQDPLSVSNWLGVNLDNQDSSDVLRRISSWQSKVNQIAPTPPLLHSASLAYYWRQARPIGRGDTLASLLVGDRWGAGRWNGSSGGLTAIGLERTHQAWKLATIDEFRLSWLNAVRQGAKAHLDLETRLRAYAVRVTALLEGRKRSTNLEALTRLAMTRPRVDSVIVARILKLTPAGAIKLLTAAVDLGLLIEMSGRSSFRTYSIPVS